MFIVKSALQIKPNWTEPEINRHSVMFCVPFARDLNLFHHCFPGKKGSLETQCRRSGPGIVHLQPSHKRMVFRKRTLWFRMSMENLRLSVNDAKHLISARKWHISSRLLVAWSFFCALCWRSASDLKKKKKKGTEAFPWPKMVQRALWTDRNWRVCF